jgi:hypothetical protein
MEGFRRCSCLWLSIFARFEHLRVAEMAGRYTGSYLD